MRIVVLIVGLTFGFWVMAEGLLAATLFDLGNADDEAAVAGLGFVSGFFALFAAAFAMAFPMVSVVLFGIASLFSLGAAASGYPNHWVLPLHLPVPYGWTFPGLARQGEGEAGA